MRSVPPYCIGPLRERATNISDQATHELDTRRKIRQAGLPLSTCLGETEAAVSNIAVAHHDRRASALLDIEKSLGVSNGFRA